MAKKNKGSKFSLSQVAAEVRKVSIKQFVHENALPYAYFVINHRALIKDDGLKPVNRRILYSMNTSKLFPKNRTMKAGKIVGDTMGNLHPHGDSSIEEAIARMAQWFSLRIPLVTAQGNVGSITGDKAAAPRYWEAQLSPAAVELVSELNLDTVDMIPTYTGEDLEPTLLPIKWPVGIINGTQGIAVGYSSLYPSHNPDEIINAVIARLENKIKTTKDLMKYVKGPDFPTGGYVLGKDGIYDYLDTGSGKFIIRGKYEIEEGKNGKHKIVFYELPYQISAEQIQENIRKANKNNKLLEIAQTRDLSDRKTPLKLSIELKAGSNIQLVLEDLWKYTNAQVSVNVNGTILYDKKPQKVGMIAMIDQFINLRQSCFIRKTAFKYRKKSDEVEKLSGIINVLGDVDKAIEIIKKSKTSLEAKDKLSKHFSISEFQANSILEMPLRKLTKSDIQEIRDKLKSLNEEISYLKHILDDENFLITEMIKELKETKSIISDKRRTIIESVTIAEIAEQEKANKRQERLLSKNVDCYITLLSNNNILTTLDNPETDIPIKYSFKTTSQGDLFYLTKSGEIKQFNVSTLPMNSQSSTNIIGVSDADFSSLLFESESIGTLIVTNLGGVNIVKPTYKEGQFIKLSNNEHIIFSKPLTSEEYENTTLLISSNDGTVTRFPTSQVRIAGQGSGTISGMKNDNCIGALLLREDDEVITISKNTIKVTDEEEIPSKNRATKGFILHRLDKSDEIVGLELFNNQSKVLNMKTLKQFKLPTVSHRAEKGTPMKTNLIAGL